MRVAVIGKGTAAIVTTLQLLKNNHEVSIVYDPDVDPINVGESSTPNFVHLLYDFEQGKSTKGSRIFITNKSC